MTARKTPLLALAAVALGLALTACGNGQDGGGPHDALASGSPTATASPTAGKGTTTGGTSSGAPKGDRAKCTDQRNYAGDPRSNAEINSIGEETGTCPAPQTDGTSGAPKEDGVKCTDQRNYAGDRRSNAEINSIGEETGTCPPVQAG
ncbi:Secreted protein OS=Streptomyces tendae OX=1932 GN=GUR47_26505 PE=4 SV=1 [Streptomyces tendae]